MNEKQMATAAFKKIMIAMSIKWLVIIWLGRAFRKAAQRASKS